MRKGFIFAASLMIAILLAPSSWGATSATTLYVTGTDTIPEPTITTEYVAESKDADGNVTQAAVQGVKTFPAVSGTNYTFSTVQKALDFAADPSTYIKNNPSYYTAREDEQYKFEYATEISAQLSDIEVNIGSGAATLPSTVDFSSYTGNITITATSALTPPADSRHFIVSGTAAITFSRLTLSGYSDGQGGGVLVSGGNATFNGVTFRRISAPQDSGASRPQGGGINIADSGNTVTISGCNFTSCSAYYGGAIYIGTDGVTFSGTNTFTGNTATYYGGALYSVAASSVACSGLQFSSSNTAERGGAAYIAGGGASFSSANFTANSSKYGGALYVQAGTVTLSGTSFTANSADQGGAIYSRATTTIGDSVTINGTNTATNGGALYIANGTTTISGSETALSSNTASSQGGAAYIAGGTLAISGSSVTMNENTASESGGAVYVYSGRLNITGESVTIESNIASSDCGGAIYVASNGVATIAGGTVSIKGNQALLGDGGGIYAAGASTVNLSGAVTFENNEAGRDSKAGSGGGIFLAYDRNGTRLNITSANSATIAFTNNHAATSGGGIYAEQNSVLTFSAPVSFSGNVAQDGNGGALWVYAANQLPESTITFTNNTANKSSTNSTTEGSGGAICVGGLAASTVTLGANHAYTFSGNSATSYGGAVCTFSADIEFSGYTVKTSNTATLGGGFASSYTGTVRVSNGSSISNQSSSGSGGAIYAQKVIITDSSFGADGANRSSGTGNSDGGGAVYSHGTLSVTNSDFAGNVSAQGGGALYAEAASVDITNSYFVSNDANSGNGGAVTLHNFCNSTITQSTFRMNKSSRLDGGAVYAQGKIDISLCYFKENKSQRSGGAVYFDQNSERAPYSEFRMSSSMLDDNGTSKAQGNGGGLYVVANTAVLTSCTFVRNHLDLAGNSGEGGGVYFSTVPIQTDANKIENCTFYDNVINEGAQDGSGGGGLSIHCEGTTEITSCTFVQNASQYKGGAIYLGDSSKLQISGTIAVGNTNAGTYDIWSDGNVGSGGYNRIGVYGTGSGVTDFYSETRNDSDRTAYPSKGWTKATFFSGNDLADNPRTDLGSNIPPSVGSTLSTQVRLQTLMLSEDAKLPLEDRATNVIPYTRRTSFPNTDERGVSRTSGGAGVNLDIGAVFYDGTRTSGDRSGGSAYTISRVEIGGVPNNLKRLGQTASLVSRVYYTNGRSVLGGYGSGEEPVTWTSDKPAIIAINSTTGDITVKSFTPGNTYVTITVTTNRANLAGNQLTDKAVIRVTEPDYSYLNTNPSVIDYINTYLQNQVPEYDITVQLAGADTSEISSSAFQSSFSATWNGASATMATGLTDSSVTAGTASNYTPSGGYTTLKNSGVGIRVSDRSNGEMIPLTYAWTFTGDEVNSLMGYDMSATEIDNAFAEALFSKMRIDFVGRNNTWTVIGSGGVGAAGFDSPGVSASGAMSANALTLSKTDGGKGLDVELTAYIANVDATQNNGPKLVQSSSGELLVVPDGVGTDGQIYGTMWIAGKSSDSSSTDTDTSTNSNSNTSSSGGGGGGGCESFGVILPAIALMFFLKRK